MATGPTTLAAQTTAEARRSTFAEHMRGLFPFRAVVLPWLVARLLTAPVLMLAGPAGARGPGQLIALDGQWFRLIALDWYDRPYAEGFWTEYPFFPLLPGLAGGLMQLGLGPTAALAGLSWLASLAAMAGAYRLAVRHLPERAAGWAPWFLAIAPGAVSMVLGYADSLFLAGAVWALVLADERRWWAAGAVAVVATSARPNGFIVVVTLVVTVVLARAGRQAIAAVALPSVVFLAAWAWYLWWATGDPLVFWSAKDAWDEISLVQLIDTPLAPRTRGALFHVVAFGALAVPYAMRVRRQPPAWAVFTALGVLPSLALGTEGLARYAIMAFPMPFAAAAVLTSRGRWPAVIFLIASAAAMVTLAVLIVRYTWLP